MFYLSIPVSDASISVHNRTVIVIVFIVRFAALLSFLGLISGFWKGDTALLFGEVFMIAIWAQMEYSNYKKRGQ
ncbi:TPA: hypothetical protein I9Y43_004036 [Kluyvera ascorbata]|nr:hypothetical protein [Kluyvera ascorbata]